MPNNIQTIIDKFDELKIVNTRDFTTSEKDKEAMVKLLNDLLIPYKEAAKQFLKDSLTLMLDEIEKELPEETPQEVIDRQMYCVALRSQGENTYRQEAINIINSHR